MPTFHSSGYAVAKEMEQILAERRAEARQVLLDELNRKNVESGIEARDENTKYQSMLRKQQTGDKFLEQFGIDQNIDPSTYKQAGELGVSGSFSKPLEGMGGEFQGPMLGGETPQDAQVGASSKFLGSPAEQKEKQQVALAESLMQNEAFIKGTPTQKMLLMRKVGITSFPAGFFDQDVAKEPGGIYTMDEATGNVTKAPGITLPGGVNHFFERNRPPQPSQAPMPFLLQPVYDNAGRVIGSTAFDRRLGEIVKPKVDVTPAPISVSVPDGQGGEKPVSFEEYNEQYQPGGDAQFRPQLPVVPIAVRPPATGATRVEPPKIPPALLTALVNAKKPVGNRPASPQAINAAKNAILVAYNTTMGVKEIVAQAIQDPRAQGMSVQGVIAIATGPGGAPLDEQEKKALFELLTALKD